MLFRLKKCVPYTQMRQFVMFNTNNTTQLKMKTIYHWRELKYSNIINPSLNVHRLLHSQNQNRFPPLMLGCTSETNIFQLVRLYFILNSSIDREFRVRDFVRGARQAVMVISKALNMQDYEALHGVVKEKAIKILRHRVDRLTPKQRELLIIDEDSFMLLPQFIKLKRNKENNDAVVQIGVCGINLGGVALDINSSMYINYVFERIYKNGVAGEWIVRLVNYSSIQ